MPVDSKVRFACSGCGKTISVSAAHAGKRGKCPFCSQSVTVPAQSAAPIQPAPPPTLPRPSASAAERVRGVMEEAARPRAGKTPDTWEVWQSKRRMVIQTLMGGAGAIIGLIVAGAVGFMTTWSKSDDLDPLILIGTLFIGLAIGTPLGIFAGARLANRNTERPTPPPAPTINAPASVPREMPAGLPPLIPASAPARTQQTAEIAGPLPLSAAGEPERLLWEGRVVRSSSLGVWTGSVLLFGLMLLLTKKSGYYTPLPKLEFQIPAWCFTAFYAVGFFVSLGSLIFAAAGSFGTRLTISTHRTLYRSPGTTVEIPHAELGHIEVTLLKLADGVSVSGITIKSTRTDEPPIVIVETEHAKYINKLLRAIKGEPNEPETAEQAIKA